MSNKKSVKQTLTTLFSALIMVAMLAAALPRPALGATQVECDENYTVKAGETLFRIAREFEVRVNRLAKANNLTRPYHLTAGQVLCIPADPEPSSKYAWSARFTGEDLTLTGSKFKKSYTFFIRVRENDAAKWYKIARVKTDKNGELDEELTVPKDLRQKTSILVCLKDGVTDYLDCKQVYRY